MYRKDVILQMGAVEAEYRAALLAVDDLLGRAGRDPGVLRVASVTFAHVRACQANLENTYLVRMFAVFEEALRDVRRVIYGRDGPITTYALIQQCASRQHVREDDRTNAHAVRAYRNTVVQGGIGLALPVTLPQSRQWLCMFMGWMPPQW